MKNLKEILSTPRQVGLFLGAGVSKAIGLPDISELTQKCKEAIGEDKLNLFVDGNNVEDALNLVHNYIAILKIKKISDELTLSYAIEVENMIKSEIYNSLIKQTDASIYDILLIWMNYVNRDFSKEIYTPNYDLIIEKALEQLKLPYFTGFVGDIFPFFVDDYVEDLSTNYLGSNIFKLFKIHGSINWQRDVNDIIINNNLKQDQYNEMLIYPSIEKYASSRKSPYISYFERMKKYLADGEKVFIVHGYSFGDEHINELLISSLRKNSRLSMLCFAYNEETFEIIKKYAKKHPNLSLITKNKQIIDRQESPLNYEKNLGDFKEFCNLIGTLIPKKLDVELDE